MLILANSTKALIPREARPGLNWVVLCLLKCHCPLRVNKWKLQSRLTWHKAKLIYIITDHGQWDYYFWQLHGRDHTVGPTQLFCCSPGLVFPSHSRQSYIILTSPNTPSFMGIESGPTAILDLIDPSVCRIWKFHLSHWSHPPYQGRHPFQYHDSSGFEKC